MAGTVPMTGFEAASGRIANLAGVDASPSSLQRRSLALGEEALRFEREEAVEGRPLEPRMHLSIDGTGIPMRKGDVEGVAGKAIVQDKAERDRRFKDVKADIEAGRIAKVVRELEPFGGRHEEVAACCRHFRNNIERMRYDGYRDQGMSEAVSWKAAAGSSG